MKKYKKNLLPIGGVAAIGLLALTACGGGDAGADGEEMPSVTIAIPPSVHGLGTATALQEGLFEEVGVDVEIEQIQSGSEGAALLAGGDAQFALFSADNAINSVVEGHSNILTVPVAQQGSERSDDPHGFGSIIVAPDGDIETVQDLEGQQIGTSVLGGEAYLNAYQALEEEGVDVSTIEWIQIPGPQQVSSVLQGQVAATITPEPNLSMAIVDESIEPLMDPTGVLPDGPAFGLASDGSWAEENPDVVEAVQGAVLEANALLNSDRELAERNLATYMDLDDEVISMVRLPVYSEEQFSVEAMESVADRLVEFDLLNEDDVPPMEDVLYTGE